MVAKDIMTKNVITITVDTPILDAMKICVNKAVSGLIVLGPDKDIVGVVTEKDLMVACDFLKGVDDTIENFIITETVCIEENTPIAEISQILTQKNIKRVPVVTDGELVGVVSRRDVLKGYINTL